MSEQAKHFRQLIEAQLAEWIAQADLLKAKAKHLAADARTEFDQQLHKLEAQKTELTEYLHTLNQINKTEWNDIKQEAENKFHGFCGAAKQFMDQYK
ncbi:MULTISPECIES: sll1863 family stress response protein [Methylomonas]|uniref:hypothetical protein n=1 Tax=Methylomonas TaxID=416 RepID=UPI001232D663|nr:hypothetical protein [Methylomonas rhizoryzae]